MHEGRVSGTVNTDTHPLERSTTRGHNEVILGQEMPENTVVMKRSRCPVCFETFWSVSGSCPYTDNYLHQRFTWKGDLR